jgi:hypothetical protein
MAEAGLPVPSCKIFFRKAASFLPASGSEQQNRITEVNNMTARDRIRGAKLLNYTMLKDIRI